MIERKGKYRLLRGDKVIADNLKISTLKKFQQDVHVVEKGHECGICFDNLNVELQPMDIIESYKESTIKQEKFNKKAGLHTTY